MARPDRERNFSFAKSQSERVAATPERGSNEDTPASKRSDYFVKKSTCVCVGGSSALKGLTRFSIAICVMPLRVGANVAGVVGKEDESDASRGKRRNFRFPTTSHVARFSFRRFCEQGQQKRRLLERRRRLQERQGGEPVCHLRPQGGGQRISLGRRYVQWKPFPVLAIHLHVLSGASFYARRIQSRIAEEKKKLRREEGQLEAKGLPEVLGEEQGVN